MVAVSVWVGGGCGAGVDVACGLFCVVCLCGVAAFCA